MKVVERGVPWFSLSLSLSWLGGLRQSLCRAFQRLRHFHPSADEVGGQVGGQLCVPIVGVQAEVGEYSGMQRFFRDSAARLGLVCLLHGQKSAADNMGETHRISPLKAFLICG